MKKEKAKKRILEGTVVSDKMDKTVVVAVSKIKQHPVYKKFFKTVKRYKAHDESNSFKLGDNVSIVEIHPVSKDKKWKVIK